MKLHVRMILAKLAKGRNERVLTLAVTAGRKATDVQNPNRPAAVMSSRRHLGYWRRHNGDRWNADSELCSLSSDVVRHKLGIDERNVIRIVKFRPCPRETSASHWEG